MGNLILSPSILSADFAALGDASESIAAAGADWIHVDVMDGCFVPVITFGPKVVSDLKKRCSLPMDVHLMIDKPERQIDLFCKAGADWLTIHFEGNIHHDRLLRQIRDNGCRCGISLVPSTPVEAIVEVLPLVDLVLVMSVNPGYGGQKFIDSSLNKITKLAETRKTLGLDFLVSVDGGVNIDNARAIAGAGTDVIVAGSSFFENRDPEGFVKALRKTVTAEEG
jgi:ribulose-phosphate 3-epimerase